MFGSDKTQLVPQLLQQKKQTKKNSKPIYRELLDTEKSLLLNFQYSENHDHHEHFSDIRPLKTKQLSFLEKKQLKQNYLQGNFRFLVNPDYEENITYVDPDKEIKWKTVEKVKYITNNVVSCPICLNEYYDTVFPKITRCGHIFCWPCILKYLSYKNSKCPLCDDFLMKEDLRTVQIMYYSVIQPGEKIFLKLKKRRKSENTIYNGEDLVEEEDFIRIKRVTWDDILRFREEESRSLIDYLSELEVNEDRDMKPYVQQALDYIGSSIENIQRTSAQAKQKKVWANEEEEKHEEGPNEEELLYFYQQINGLNIFLHPIDNKYIKSEFESKDLPLFIEASLIESKGFQQTEVSQRRYKFLNHIPLNSDISFVEIDMKNILSKERQQQLEEEMKTYKENNASKKELAPKLVTSHSTPPVIPKSITVPTEGKYKVEFPASLSELKLDDKQDYPELTSSNSHISENPKHTGWQTLGPSKKKKQASKQNSILTTATSKSTNLPSDKNENLTETPNDKTEAISMYADNEWKEVKPDKYFIHNKRK